MRPSRVVVLAIAGAGAAVLVAVLAAHTSIGIHFDRRAAGGASGTGVGWFDGVDDDLLEAINPWVVAALAAAVAAVAWRRRARPPAIAAVALAGSLATVALAKAARGGTYPSGHSAFALSVAFLALVLAPRSLRPAVTVAAVGWSASVGVASVVAGGHVPSDVLGGYLVALVWSALAAAVIVRPGWSDAPPRDPPPAVARLAAFASGAIVGFALVQPAVLGADGSGSATLAAAVLEAAALALVLVLARLLGGAQVPAAAALAVALLVALLCAGCAGTDRARVVRHTVFVSVHGPHGGDGTRSSPYRTLGRAFAAAKPGTTIVLERGTYAASSVLAASGTPAQPIVVRAAAGARAVLTNRLKIAGSHVRVVGLEFRGGGPGAPGDVLVYVSHAHDVLIAHDRILDSPRSGIFVGDSSGDVRVVGNLIAANGTSHKLDHGIYFGEVAGGTIADNVIVRNAAYGIQLYPAAEGIVVTENTIGDNGRSGILIGGEATVSDDNLVVNNIIAYNGEDGVRTYWGGPQGTGNAVRNNLLFGNAARAAVGPGITIAGSIELAPQFVDRRHGDYRLRASSPAIERGLLKYTTRFDYAGERRPQDSLSDLGAYELTAG